MFVFTIELLKYVICCLLF